MSMLDMIGKHSLKIGIVAMALVIMATLLKGGSLGQKFGFLIGVAFLILTAYLNKQKMFVVLEVVIAVGITLSFFSNLIEILKYSVLLAAAAFGIFYLIKVKYSKVDKWWPLGGIGLLILSFGLATNAVVYPILFNSLLVMGGFFIALYSGIGFFLLKVRVSAIFLVLNILFVINPSIIVISSFL